MRRALITIIACTCMASVSAAQSLYEPPAPGTMLSWSYKFGDSQFTRLSEVVATGEDFVIYDPDLRYATGKPSN